MKTVLKRLGLVFLGLVLVFWAACHVFLGGFIRSQVQAIGAQTGYRIDIGEIDLAPLLLRARLNQVRLALEQGDDLLTFKQLEIDARFLPLLMGRLSFDRIALEDPVLLLERAAGQGRQKPPLWNWQTFIERVQRLGDADTAKSQAGNTIKIHVDEIALMGGKVAVRDGVSKSSMALGPLSIRLTDLSNVDESGHVGGASLTSKYVLNLGAVKVPLPHLSGMADRQLAFDNVVAAGEVVENSHSALRVALDLKLDEGAIKSNWHLTEQGALNGEIAVENLAVKPWLSLAPTTQQLDSASGVIDGRFDLKQDAVALAMDGDIQLKALDVRLVGAKEPLLAWTNTSLSRLHLLMPRAENKPSQLTLSDITIDQPKIRFIIDHRHQSNFQSLFSVPGETPAPQASAASRSQAPGLRYDVRTIRLKHGAMYFADESIKPAFRVDVTDLEGSLQGMSNDPRRNATLVLNGRAANVGSLRARGQLAFADPRQNHDVNLNFRNIPLNATNPYAMTFAGYAIEDGRIDVDLHYVTKDGQLQGQNRFVIKKIKLGDEVPDYEGTRLPLGLAIALLEDSDGMIDVNIPVRGNVNDPEFSAGHLVWQAVKTVLTNVVTAPFRALGTLLGIENMDAIGFVPGESALPPDDDEQLGKLSGLLVKRPQSKLVIHGSYDPSVDGPELARAMADQAILQAAGIKVAAGEPLPLPNLTDPAVKAGLKSAYGSQVGRIKLGQRLMSLPDNAERDTQLRQELIESYQVSDDQLKQLAAQRAAAVKARLLSADQGLAGRISIGDPETVSSDGSRVPLAVQLEPGS